MASASPSEALAALKQIAPDTHLSIVKISEPISTTTDTASSTQSPSNRRSDVSTDAFYNPTPSSLEEDLTHYKELFSKLRFSYIEQVTKEKFLRSIVGDPPLVVGHHENIELEAELAKVKEELQRRKEEVRLMIEEMEKMGRALATRYKKVQLQMTQLSDLPASIEALETTISTLREAASHGPHAYQSGSALSSSQTLSLPATLELIAEREVELAALDRQLASVNSSLPRSTREADAMERELARLEKKKIESVAQAKEAQRKKQEGESDGLEEMGRWYRGAEKGLKDLVGVEG
ncbi:conserved hypothetical protein [Histoplasma capsulatum G186AR]|uniref:Kinetochore protein Sos7 coiled-coil domain-containing protein n=2 Tax=Ajellomyces capsulatus TaxID=5037 RepID=C0NLR6_AJECG|nr:uncharacterized protein HCBG_04446 [Histoplasma capsulatum G186AR]EEH07567.1 conserved hypothetical protein [Histoplasma capsulatum G186AR]KAG5304290.1 hypothetical protein I7I52_02564 [Histoplasma capsulatum]QSS69888.1 hypothetical protein I7I50_11326 [Histoplasma capsulatum G186AR]